MHLRSSIAIAACLSCSCADRSPPPTVAVPLSASPTPKPVRAQPDTASQSLAFEQCAASRGNQGDWRPSLIDTRAAILTARVPLYGREGAALVADAAMTCMQRVGSATSTVGFTLLNAFGQATVRVQLNAIEHQKRHFVRFHWMPNDTPRTNIIELVDGMPRVFFSGAVEQVPECLGEAPTSGQPSMGVGFLDWPQPVRDALCGRR